MKRPTSSTPTTITFLPQQRSGGFLDTLSDGDVVDVSPESASALGRWALAETAHMRGPVRVRACHRTSDDEVRVAYAPRTLLAMLPSDNLSLSPWRTPTSARRNWSQKLAEVVGDQLLGAPPLALRCTEGLAGDDGERIARVDPTVLERLGLRPGEEAVLSWGPRSTVVRLLSQTPETAAAMHEQLHESSERQTRPATGDPTVRLRTPPHLRIWVSATARHALGITRASSDMSPDTIVRVRRHLPSLLRRQASAAAVPATTLFVAMAAVPGISWWKWAGVIAVVLVLVALPLRRSALKQGRTGR